MLNSTNILVRKPRSVLWLASHCKTKSHREEYVAELSKYVDVQKFGKCAGLGAKNFCPHAACPKAFIGQYKFFLAFENR
jgi:alpha-1,3-fucosyltransferase